MLDVTLRDLEYVVAVSEERNFTRAAERLHMAQPALSQAILRVERRLGVTLFARTSRRVAPTAAGRVLTDRARPILEQVGQAVTATRAAGGTPYTLRVHVSEPSLQTPRSMLGVVRAKRPELAVHQTTLPHATVVEELRSGTLGLAIGDRITGPGISSELIRRESVGVLMTSSHPLAVLDAVPIERLADFALVPIDERLSPWNSYVERLLASVSAKPTWSPSTAFGAVAGSDLVTDNRTLLVSLETIGDERPAPFTWRPLAPHRDVGWYLNCHDARDTPSVVHETIHLMREGAVASGW